MKKILFLTPYPFSSAPSQRFRFEQYLVLLKGQGFEYALESFLDNKIWNILYKPGNTVLKTIGILKGFVKRFFIFFSLREFDYVFIHRETSPIGPPIFEWIIAKILNKKIIFDFDDAIWLNNTSKENRIISALKWHDKAASICKWSFKVSCGNQFLVDYAKLYNSNVVLNPTTIDTENVHIPKKYKSPIPIIGWTGTHSTCKYLDIIIPILKELSKKYQFIFKIISNSPPSFKLPFLQYVEWSEECEIEELNTFDIGIMPLTDDDWAKGKCGFKALQYMALEIPALVSPVGVNAEIVEHGINGFHCQTKQEWEESIKLLLINKVMRNDMGKMGRKKVIENYSVKSNKENFLSLFD